MKIQVSLEQLQKKISFVNHAVSQKSQLPILLNILLTAKNGVLTLSATDLEIGIQTEIQVEIEEEGSVTVVAKIFLELINNLSSDKITLQTKGESLEVVTSKSKSTLQTINSDEFPKLYEDIGEEVATLKKEDIENDFSKVAFAASLDSDRPALSGILVKKDTSQNGGFLLVATDGYRLSLLHEKLINKRKEEEKELLVPARVVREIVMLKEDGDVEIRVSRKNNQVFFVQKETVLVGRLIEAEFPNYERIIPTDFSSKIYFEREELQKAVKTCSIFARDSANIVKLALKKETLVVSANTPSVGENSVEVDAKLEGEENEIAFNARYLLDLFANLSDEEMFFEMSGPLNPGLFRIKDNASFLHIIMPIRVQSESERT